jgi:hypothetical protein
MDKKTQTIFFVVVGIVFIVFIILFIDSISENKKDSNDIVPNEVNVFDKDSTNKIYKNKVKAYNDLDEEREKEKVKEGVNVDLGKIFTSERKTEQEIEESQELERKTETEKQVVSSPKPQTFTRKKAFENTVKTEPTGSNDMGGVNNDPASDFGIYSVKKKSVEQGAQESKATQNNFYPAYFEEDTKIKDNSPVVLILRSDALLEGISFKKNATLYGYASDAGNYFDISITSVKNTDGKSYHVNNLVIYNEKYGRGIAHEGKLDNSVKESADETANDLGANMPVSTSATEQVGVNVATRAVGRTIQNLSKARQPEISIRHGYKIFVKSE